jgi:hypothetical protein
MSGDELSRAVSRLVNQVGHWTPERWSRPAAGAGPDAGTRADLVYGLVQRVADRAAHAEAVPRRLVPRLDSNLALPDQLRVVTADLVAATPPPDVLAIAIADVTTTHDLLSGSGADSPEMGPSGAS